MNCYSYDKSTINALRLETNRQK